MTGVTLRVAGCVLWHAVSGEQKIPWPPHSDPGASHCRQMARMPGIAEGWHFLSHKGNWPRWS